jgi:hypothetical protein
MEDGIPVEFEYQGKMYNGFVNQPHGAGSKGWQLSMWEQKKWEDRDVPLGAAYYL